MRRRIMNIIEDDVCVVDREPLYANGDGSLGQILIYDENQLKFINKDNLDSYPSASAIGVVVIPKSHNVYETDEVGVMSLVSMDCSNPTTGSTTEQTMYWGGYGTDISDLPNLDLVPTLGTFNNTPSDTIQGTTSYAYLPSDRLTGKVCPHDSGTKYYNSTSSSYNYLPSPYLTNGDRNPLYYQTEAPSSERNALADFDGIGNTCLLTKLATAQSGWKTATTITNNSGAGYYPAACCCWRFTTDGVPQGYWYLPACGELGYIMPRFNEIKASIQAVIDAGKPAVLLGESYGFWSSTEYSNDGARYVRTDYGGVYGNDKNNNYRVRAFLRVVPSAS